MSATAKRKRSTKTEAPTTAGTVFGGGFYVGRFFLDGVEHALIVAPKKEGQHDDMPWNKSDDLVKGAMSFCDGLANTEAMVKADSDLAKWARALNIEGYADWYLPSMDELEICYRYLKPNTSENSLYARSGINVSVFPATYPYSANPAKQTKAKSFRDGGKEEFDTVWYWSSTQHASSSDCAWGQHFVNGSQDSGHEGSSYRARAVRRIKI